MSHQRRIGSTGQGRMEEDPVLCPGPQKYGSFWLRVRPSTREFAETCGKHLPRDSAPNVSIIKQVVAANILRAVKKRSTVFVTDFLHNSSSATVSKVIHRCESSVYRVWLRCMMGIYPVQSYLKRIGLAQSPVFSFRWSLPPDLACIPKQADSLERPYPAQPTESKTGSRTNAMCNAVRGASSSSSIRTITYLAGGGHSVNTCRSGVKHSTITE